ncbi:MAG TPA: PP2C family protein-serine/threonine phosphatase [Candidatus Ozemobacteraceae bacterium]|nr:PP2C family protein-serine/threonine phosphatase [Candidatus Ozemobacteraceae bacterium]
MRTYLKRYPFILFTAGILLVVGGIALTLNRIPADIRYSAENLLSLGFLVFTSLLLGIISFWWNTIRNLSTDHVDGSPLPDTPPADLTDLFFQSNALIDWYKSSISRLHNRCVDLERISHLLGYMNYAAELGRQLHVALQLCQELFPTMTILIYTREASALQFACGTKPRTGEVLPLISKDDPITRKMLEIIRQEIDIERLNSDDWKNFSLPLRGRQEPRDLTILPLMVWNRILGLVVFTNSERRALADDEKVMATLFNKHIAICIENHRLFKENLRQDRLIHEVDIARTLQTSTLPQQSPIQQGLDVHGTCVPCNEISGDYYDLIPLSNDRLLATIADVSGKGLPAALFLSKIQALVRAMADKFDGPGPFLLFLSEQLAKEQMGPLFATMIIAVFDPKKRTVTCASAGHCKPLVVRSGTGFVEEIDFDAGIPLGLFEQEENAYSERTVDLLPGDGVFLYTDGVLDLLNRQGERFGLERLKTALDTAPAGKAASVVYHVMNEMNRFKETIPHDDDITMVYVKSEKAAT